MSTTYARPYPDTPVARPQEPTPVLMVLRGRDMADHFAALLNKAGYPIVQAASPDEARAVLSKQPFRLALVDVDWGTAAVADLADAARRGEPPCPVAVVVGWWDERVGEVYRSADLLIYKPPTERQLLSAVEALAPWQPLSA